MSAIVADVASGYHILKIDGYSRTKGTPTGEFINSRPFTVGGHRWCIQYYPNGQTSEYADYISIFLFLDESVSKAIKVQSKFCFIDDMEEQTPSLTSKQVNSFESYRGWGTATFIKREDLEKSKHLKDDSFVVRCDMVIINELRTEEMSEAPTATFVSVPPSDLHQHLGDLLQSEKGADLVFEVGSETFKAHRCVLAARSPVFSAELFGQMKESDAACGIVHVEDMEAHVFKALLFFVYTDSLPELNEEEQGAMSQHLLVAADRYDLERLKLICEHKLCKYIDASTLATILALAEQHHCPGLKKACFNFLSSPVNLTAVLATDDAFEHLNRTCPSVLKELIAKLGM
jgi:speckle-type POZ protein